MKAKISIASGKGGVGKTTITANLAYCLAELGNKVLVIDGDFGLRNLDIALGLANEIVYDIGNVISGEVSLEKAIIEAGRTNVFLLAAPQLRENDSITPETLQEFMNSIEAKFDYCIIDCPAGIGETFHIVVSPADLVLLVTTPEAASIRDTDRTAGVLESIGKDKYMLIINRIRPSFVKKGKMQNVYEVVETLGISTLGIIPESQYITETAKNGQLAASNTKKLIREPFLNIAKRLEGKAVPVIKINKKKWRKA
ncbi:septum site-determining protein MinD [Treponema sp. R6D11]